MNNPKYAKNAQKPALLPFYAFPVPVDEDSFSVLLQQAKEQYSGWLERSRTCETNSQTALNERDYDYWHNLYLEAEIEATYYWKALKLNHALPEDN